MIVNVLTPSGRAQVRENVDEAGTFVAHLSAHDADSGQYGRVECQLDDAGAHLFRLESLDDNPDTRCLICYFYPPALPSYKVGALSADGCCLSVRLSVPCLTLSRERKGIGS